MEMTERLRSLLMFAGLYLVFALAMALILIPVYASPVASSGVMPLQETTTDSSGTAISGIAIAAGLAVGLAGIGAGLGMGTASAAALGAITEKPETFGKSILYVVFIEVVAIYGFVIAYMLLGYLQVIIAH